MAKNEDKGWLRLYRSLMDNPFWTEEPFTIGQAWVDLLMLANYSDTERFFRGQYQKVERGQIVTSDRYLAERWGWSRDRVRRTIKKLENAKMLTTNRSSNNTTITIENWAKYQEPRSTNRSTGKTSGKTSGDTQYKKDKNEKESIKSLAPAHQAQEAQEVKEDYGNLWLTPTEWNQLEALCESVGANMIEYVDRVSEWLGDNKVDPKKHVGIFRKFLRSDGYL